MATQSQKFNGKNFYNNCVTLDFENKKCGFVPIKDKSFISYYFQFLLSLYVRLTILSIIVFLFAAAIINFMGGIEINNNMLLFLILTPSFLVALPTSFLFFNKQFREHDYPSFNYHLLKLLHKTKKKKINNKCLVNRKFIIPRFFNVCVKYNLYGEFANLIKKIDIQNIYENEPDEWFAVFEFYKTPKNGYMELEYL